MLLLLYTLINDLEANTRSLADIFAGDKLWLSDTPWGGQASENDRDHWQVMPSQIKYILIQPNARPLETSITNLLAGRGMPLQFQKGSALLWRNTHRYLHIYTSSQYYLNCMKMLIYSLNLNTEGQQEEVRKCIHYFWDLMLAHSVFMSCLRKKRREYRKQPQNLDYMEKSI